MAVPYPEDLSDGEDSTQEVDEGNLPWDYPGVQLTFAPFEIENWAPRAPRTFNWDNYIPDFSNPEYDDAFKFVRNGTVQKRRTGGVWETMRPAILPIDPPASQYAKRFGIYRDPDPGLNENSEARSRLTPVAVNNNQPQWDFEQSWQALFFSMYTAQELVDTGAFDPGQFIQEPDLQGSIHHLFARDRWTQGPVNRQSDVNTKDNFTFNVSYNLNGVKRPWDVQRNDELWNALQPALQMATRLTQSDHPFWRSILSIYHMRPIPTERDGRTQALKAEPQYRPYTSIWYDVDRDKMYPAARTLMDLNFDSAAATMEVLNRSLKFSFARSDTALNGGETMDGGFTAPDYRWIRIVLKANYIWPLLAPQYSMSEKLVISYFVAKTIVHELAHAARLSLQMINTHEDLLVTPPWTPPPGTTFNQEVINNLQLLGNQSIDYRALGQHFFQEDTQMEEGKSLEKEFFGFDTVPEPSAITGRSNDFMAPIIYMVSWPWYHPKVHLQNQLAVDAGRYGEFANHEGYGTNLLDPPGSAYDFFTPLPVSAMARFMYQSWWDTDFTKFGHQAIKQSIHSTDPARFSTSLRANEFASDAIPYLTSVFRTRIAVKFVSEYAVDRLSRSNQFAILKYMTLLTREAAAGSLLRNRLHYDKRTWPNTEIRIQTLGAACTQSLERVWATLAQNSQRALSEDTAADMNEGVNGIRQLLTNLMELNRQLGVQIQYSQAIAAQYILKNRAERIKTHRRYIKFLRQSLMSIRNTINDTVNAVAPSHYQDGRLEWKTISAPWEAAFIYMAQRSAVALSSAAREQINSSINSLASIRRDTQQTCADIMVTTGHLDNLLVVLGDYSAQNPVTRTPLELFPGVPVAMKMMGLSRTIEKAAIREIARLNDPGLEQTIKEWMDLLRLHSGLNDRITGVIGDTKRAAQDLATSDKLKTADLRATLTVLFQVKRNQVQPTGPVVGGFAPRDRQIAALRNQITRILGNSEVMRRALRSVCEEKGDVDEFDTIMSMAYPGYVPQGQASAGPAATGALWDVFNQ